MVLCTGPDPRGSGPASPADAPGGLATRAMTEEEKLPPETKRAIVGLILWVLGGLCGVAGLFYLLYLLFMAVHHHHHHHF